MDNFFIQTYTAMLSASVDAVKSSFGTNNTENLISIVGIVVTAVLGIISSYIAWKLGLRSIKKMKLNYNKELLKFMEYPGEDINGVFSDIKISYGGNELSKPSLLLINIKNTGNAGIGDPPVLVRCKKDSNVNIFAGIIRDTPPGYESKWSIIPDENNQFHVKLEHINPEQTVRVLFLIDNCTGVDEIEVLCPMQDVTIEQSASDSEMIQMISSYLEDMGFAGKAIEIFRKMSNRIR